MYSISITSLYITYLELALAGPSLGNIVIQVSRHPKGADSLPGAQNFKIIIDPIRI